jgi:ABC-type amino acid transport substrate-binding protein
MNNAIGVIATACLLAVASAPAKTQGLEGTLKKVKETGTITIGHRDSSIPLSYLDDKLQPIGFSIELCRHVVETVKAKLGLPSLNVKYNPVTSATRIPLVANGTVDVECGSTANMTSRQKQVGFSYTFDQQFKTLVDETLAKLMRSGEFERLYAQWFEGPIPPRAINIQLPMSEALKRTIKEPNDKPNS